MSTKVMRNVIGTFVLVGLAIGCGPNKGVEKGKDDALKKIESSGGKALPQTGGPTAKDKEKTALGGAGKKN